MKRNFYQAVTPHLTSLGIHQKLIDRIPVSYQYFGMIEICSCGIEHCFSRRTWIIKHQEGFTIPLFYVFCSPIEWLETHPESINPEHSAEKGEIKNRKGDIIKWRGSKSDDPYPLLAYHPNFEIGPEYLSWFDSGLMI